MICTDVGDGQFADVTLHAGDYVGEKALDPIFHFDISRQTGLGTLSDIVKGSDDASFIDAAPSAPPLIP